MEVVSVWTKYKLHTQINACFISVFFLTIQITPQQVFLGWNRECENRINDQDLHFIINTSLHTRHRNQIPKEKGKSVHCDDVYNRQYMYCSPIYKRKIKFTPLNCWRHMKPATGESAAYSSLLVDCTLCPNISPEDRSLYSAIVNFLQ